MPPSSEPEKYSIEQMMERLQNRSTDDPAHPDGEWVARADGSKAIKVRKRKRRTNQPHKLELQKNRRARIIQVSASLILILSAAFVGGIAIVYANSLPFRQGLVQKIMANTGAAVELNQFRMTPTRANAGQFSLSWPEGNVLKSLHTHGFSAEIAPTSFFGKSMQGQEVSSPEARLMLRIPNPEKPTCLSPISVDSQALHFTTYSTRNLHVIFGEETAPLGRLEKAEATFQARNPSGRPQLLLNGGDITIPGWPNLKIDRSHIEFRGGEMDIIGMRLRHEDDHHGTMSLAGTVSPYDANGTSTLTVEMQAFPIAGIAGPEWTRLLSGKIDTTSSPQSNFLSITPSPSPESSLVISFSNSLATSFKVNGFSFLFGLSQLLNDKWFERPLFENDVRGVIRRERGNIRFEELNFISKGRMSLRGNLSMNPDQKLSGNLDIGVAVGLIDTSDTQLNAMFGPAEDGFRRVKLKISGTSTSPADNFKELYHTATAQPAPPKAENIPSFEELTTPGKGP